MKKKVSETKPRLTWGILQDGRAMNVAKQVREARSAEGKMWCCDWKAGGGVIPRFRSIAFTGCLASARRCTKARRTWVSRRCRFGRGVDRLHQPCSAFSDRKSLNDLTGVIDEAQRSAVCCNSPFQRAARLASCWRWPSPKVDHVDAITRLAGWCPEKAEDATPVEPPRRGEYLQDRTLQDRRSCVWHAGHRGIQMVIPAR